MANHRPKSLSELNQVYDKAMQAQRAIKEGSQSLSDEAPVAQAPSQSIFDELRQQAGPAKKAELYDSEIADIANDFLKRYTKPEQRKPQAAPKEIRRPAPSIQSLYHTPVKQSSQEANDVSIAQQDALPVENKAPVSTVRPRPFESIEVPEAEAIPQPEAEAPPAPLYRVIEDIAPEQTVQFSIPEAYTVKNPNPVNRMTSAERNDLINEYKRVMSDDEDAWFDDDEDYARPKKSGFWSKLKKRRQEPEEEFAEPASEEIAEEISQEEDDEALPMTDIYSGISHEEPEEAEGEEIPMSLYDYIEADFDYSDEAEFAEEIAEDIPEEAVTAEEYAPEAEETAEEPEEAPEAEINEEIAEDIPEEAVTAEEYAPEAEETAEEPEVAPEAEFAEEIAEDIPEEAVTAEEYAPEAEEIIPEDISDEEAETVEAIIYEDFSEEENDSYKDEAVSEEESSSAAEEDSEEVIYPSEEEIPTAGMVFDDVFSVSDESRRSYTGGDWSHSTDEKADSEEADGEDLTYEEAPQAEIAVKTKKIRGERKKVSPLLKAFLSLVLVLLVASAGLVTALGSVIGVDTGKLFGNSYRAFEAKQNFSAGNIYAGDLVLTQDNGTVAQTGDCFVYVNSQTHQFMIGKLKGTTYGLTGDRLYVAQNESGNALILREDTLGTVVKTYSGIGSVLSALSNNFIIIDAVILVLFVAVLLVLILAGRGKKQKLTVQAESSQPAAYEEEYSEDYADEEYDEAEAFDPDEYDTDDIEESLFSGI